MRPITTSRPARTLLLAISAALWFRTPNRGYYRSPAIYGQTIVFTAEGDL
jgi:hypothetical protein